MKLAINGSFADVNWEPLKTSFIRNVITQIGVNDTSIILRNDFGSISAPITASIFFNGQITDLDNLRSLNFNQVSRELRQIQVTQGSLGTLANESFNAASFGIVDIVIVVDNSASMSEEQARLSSGMPSLLSAIGDSDWRIVVVSTDGYVDYFKGPISKSTFNPTNWFAGFVGGAGTNGSSLERPVKRAVDALKWRPAGSWLRQSSTVAVIMLTDEDNCYGDSESGYASGYCPDDFNTSYLTNYLSMDRTLGTEARVYGIFWHPSQSQSQCPTAMKQATNLAEMVQQTGGIWGSICDSDYSQTLNRISQNLAKTLKFDLTLSSVPASGTFQMTVNGQPWESYTLTDRSVHFTTPPPLGALINVKYRSGVSGVIFNSFELPEEPADGQVSAVVNGSPTPGVTYNVSTKKAVFSTTPPENSIVVISYKSDTPLNTIFPITPGIDVATLKIYINGTAINASQYSYDSSTGLLVFATPPPEGAQMRAEW
jgi:hypothetical protein